MEAQTDRFPLVFVPGASGGIVSLPPAPPPLPVKGGLCFRAFPRGALARATGQMPSAACQLPGCPQGLLQVEEMADFPHLPRALPGGTAGLGRRPGLPRRQGSRGPIPGARPWRGSPATCDSVLPARIPSRRAPPSHSLAPCPSPCGRFLAGQGSEAAPGCVRLARCRHGLAGDRGSCGPDSRPAGSSCPQRTMQAGGRGGKAVVRQDPPAVSPGPPCSRGGCGASRADVRRLGRLGSSGTRRCGGSDRRRPGRAESGGAQESPKWHKLESCI